METLYQKDNEPESGGDKDMIKRDMWACPLDKWVNGIQASHYMSDEKRGMSCFLCEEKCKPIKAVMTIKEAK